MIKKWRHSIAICLIVVMSLGSSLVSASEIERANVSFQEMTYERVNKETVDLLIQEGKQLVIEQDVEKLREWESKYYTTYYQLMSMARLAYLYYCLDMSDSYFYNEYVYCIDLAGTLQSNYISLFEEEGQNYSGDTKAYFNLASQRENLLDLYNNLQETTKVAVGGKMKSMQEVLQDTSISQANKYKLIMKDWYDEYNRQAGELFLKIVKIDNEQAKLAGYASVADSMYKTYNRDYTPLQSKQFAASVKKYLPSIYKQMNAQRQIAVKKLLNYTYQDEDTLLDKMQKGLVDELPFLQESFAYLKQYGLYDINYNARKMDGGFTTYLMGYNEPFISLNYSKDYQTVMAFIHELGHFNFDFTTAYINCSLDLSETYSQGLELLALPYHEEIMGSKEYAEATRLSVTTDMLRGIIDGCVYEEFLQAVYANPNMSVDQLNKLYGKIASSYGLDQDDRSWIEITHNFETPFYYLSYSMSAVAALEIWQQSLTDYDKAISTYTTLIDKGTQYKFQEALKQSGLSNPLEEASIKKIVDAVSTYFKISETEQSKAA